MSITLNERNDDMSSYSSTTEEMRIAFGQFAQNGESAKIAHYSREQLETALIQLRRSAGMPFYHAIERRLESMKDAEAKSRRRKDLWTDRVITFALGIIGGLILAWIIWKMKWNG